eukprot:TRINITY_DN774096_c0_g1_i1.p1 TRINITY_DN774096_c0_g1~~TRINITY_DN774096_c0_g1_i1.p1  ORF type:complete len:314 (-),score=77.59 TRINITY_DN774096_c0_g1_i1:89-982(-)
MNPDSILLDSSNKILRHEVASFFEKTDGGRKSQTITDFDGVFFEITNTSNEAGEKDRDSLAVSILIPCFEELKEFGLEAHLNEKFGDMECRPMEGYDYGIHLDRTQNIENVEQLVDDVANLRKFILGAPLRIQLQKLMKDAPETDGVLAKIQYRETDCIFVIRSADKVTVIHKLSFEDVTNQALANVFLQEIQDVQRSVPRAPPVHFSAEAPRELSEFDVVTQPETAYMSFVFFKSHLEDPKKLENIVGRMIDLRYLLLSHVKSAKTYLHTRMRKKCDEWVKVLNRAKRPKVGAGKR